ncbi:hemerythrin-like domain-containing protein [Kibdelosporangium banguiense]|uniref:Hemerythrin-like domain-containing protein n=1 Tax=Kibdelosporangium banguiense TaxID=1365924 RepID=A0ABS4TJ47_9PSEU|nr:hemerythrin domain-containing protein [Kibdelosporangium banguiense]MBP2324344.1 hemerythrin-like domain-containing protein [Kibdelosporangium banguiense]
MTSSQHLSTENGVAGLPEHIHGFALMHVAMRRDARRIAKAAPNITRADAGAVATWFDQVLNVIDWHHRTEDDVLFPELRRRVPGFAAKEEQELAHDHHELDRAMADVARSLRGDLAALPEAAQRMENVLLEHLKVEEPIVFPVFVGELTPRQYRGLEDQVLRSAGPGMRAFLFPWLFDGIDRRTASRTAAAIAIPAPVRLVGSTVLTWRYDRMITPVVNLGRR